MDYTFYLFILLTFLTVVLLLEGAFLMWNSYKGPEATRIERRLRTMSAGAPISAEGNLLKERMLSDTTPAIQLLLKMPRVRQLDRFLIQSGLNLQIPTFLFLSAGFALIGFLLPQVIGLPFLVSILAGLCLAPLPLLYVQRKRQQRLQRFEEQLPDALDMMARALRAGHAFLSAMKMVGDEMSEPIAGEFRITFEEVNYGFSIQEALLNLATRVPITDLRFFVLSVLIQRETGGNLSELLNNLSTLIRGRLKLLGTVRVLSSEGKLSAWILSLLPFSLGIIINIINPSFMKILWQDPVGIMMLIATMCMMLVGFFWMRQIIKIHI